MNKQEQLEERLASAEEIIKKVAKRWNYEDANNHLAKYHPPDPDAELKEIFREYYESPNHHIDGNEATFNMRFNKARELGLFHKVAEQMADEAIEETETMMSRNITGVAYNVSKECRDKMKSLKEKYSKEST